MSERTVGATPRRDWPTGMSLNGRSGGGHGDATDLTRNRETFDYRDMVSVLIFSLLALGWLAVTRNVRVATPADLNIPSRADAGGGATLPEAGVPHALTAGSRPGPQAIGSN